MGRDEGAEGGRVPLAGELREQGHRGWGSLVPVHVGEEVV